MMALLAALDPQSLIERGGLVVLALVVFAESGLLIGFFLPGDSLLFVAGFIASGAGGGGLPPIALVIAVVVLAAIAGDQVGYAIGRRVGAALFRRPRSRLFDPRNVVRTEQFFERHGAKTIVLARFVPIVRTFAPVVAGVGSMRYRTFVAFNVVGGLLWGVGVTLAGYFLGDVGPVRRHVELATVGVVSLSLVPVVLEIARHRRNARRARPEALDVVPGP
jgi:membrane-associated protein